MAVSFVNGSMGTLGQLALVYAQLSLLAFGGANAILPEMQRQVVDVHHWMTAREFASLFALAQAAPGPNMMVVSLVGWRVAGVWGALVTTGAVLFPSSILTLLVVLFLLGDTLNTMPWAGWRWRWASWSTTRP